MSDSVLAVLYALVLVLGLTSGSTYLERRGRDRPRWRVGVVALWLVVAVPSVLQHPIPALLDHLRRDPHLIGNGEAWRLLTSAVVQDGGWTATAFNLIALAVITLVAGEVWGASLTWVLFWTSQLVASLLVLATFSQTGAGNSMATFGLGMTMLVHLLVADRRPSDVLRLAVGVAIAAILLLDRDIHGLAVCVGLLLGAAMEVAQSGPWSFERSSADDA